MSRRLSLLSAAALGIAAVYGFLPLKSGRTQPVDPTLPVQRVVGDPAGAAPTDRVDAERSGRARQLLPRMPSVVFRARVPGGIDHPVCFRSFWHTAHDATARSYRASSAARAGGDTRASSWFR